MQAQDKIKVDTLNVPKDERYQIFEAGSPSLLKDSEPKEPKEPKVKIHNDKDHPHGEVIKTIKEFKSYGIGTMEYLCCRFDPEDLFLATGAADGLIHFYPIGDTEKPVSIVNAADTPGIPITCLRWRPHTGISKTKQVLVSACADGNISHWHVGSGKLLHRIMEKDNQVLCLDYNNDGTQFASAGKDRIIRIYDENTKSLLTSLEGGLWQHPGHSNRIFSIKFHPTDPNVIVSAGWDNTVFFWDVREGKSFANIYGPAICGDSLDIKGNYMLTGSWRTKDQLELWDYSSRKKIQDIPWDGAYQNEKAYVYSCQFSKNNDDSIIAGCSLLNEVKIFDRNNGYKSFGKIGDQERGVYSVDYANSMDLFGFCGGDGHTHLVQITSTIKNEEAQK